MVATEYNRNASTPHNVRGAGGDVGADAGDGREELDAAPHAERLARGDRDVAGVDDVVAEAFEALGKLGEADGGGAHLDSAP